MQYDDLELEISPCLCGKMEVRVLASEFGRPREAFVAPYRPRQFLWQMERLEALICLRQRGMGARRARFVKEEGAKFFEALFPGKVRSTLERCQAAASSRGRGLRIRLGFGDGAGVRPEVQGVPWEMAFHPESRDFLSCGPRSQIVRTMDSPRSRPLLPAEPPLSVLCVLPNAKESPLPEISKHRRALRRALAGSQRVRLSFLEPPTTGALQERLLEEEVHVLHFLGHGDFRRRSGEGLLIFEGPKGRQREVSGRALGELLEGVPSLRLVTLMGCLGARVPRRRGQDPAGSVAAALAYSGVPAVLAMQHLVSSTAAQCFVEAFYQGLVRGAPVDRAVAEARVAVKQSNQPRDTLEWATPVLMLRSPDARLLPAPEE
ncbi:MAG: CHAT domain-containing protein [Acidobacteria bacterium]|nr:CHAT domain-containing protein [Acidobacteriota bacterium]